MIAVMRKSFLLPVVCLLLAAACSGPGPGGERLNVLLVTLDTTRADHLGCYGYPLPTSPNLDRLAGDGILFDLAISTSGITPISHASIFTGMNPDRHGLRVFYGEAGHYLDPAHPTLATILKSRSFRTGAFISAYPASERFGLHHGFDTFSTGVSDEVMTGDPRLRPPKDGYWMDRRTASAQRRADATTDEALAWLDQPADGGNPFLLWVHYFDPHDPSLVPPEEINSKFGADSRTPDALLKIYDSEIFFMDSQFGRLISRLKETGQYDNTLIVVVGDHGQGLGDHNWFPHRLLYQEQIRVPLIVRLPGEYQGAKVGALARTTDILPTVLERLGIETPEAVQGSDLEPILSGTSREPRIGMAEALNTLDTHAPAGLPPHQQDLLFMAMDRKWKLIHHVNQQGNDELYNLLDDPKERVNQMELHGAEAKRLLEVLQAAGIMNIELSLPEEAMDEEAMEKLRSLGYVGGGN